MKRLLVVFSCVWLGSCQSSLPVVSPAGTWMGVGQPGHPEARFITRFEADGTYTSSYCLAHGKSLHVVQGQWSLVDGVLTIVMQSIDEKPVSAKDGYQTDSFNGNHWTLELSDSTSQPDDIGNDYDFERVGDAMQMTGC